MDFLHSAASNVDTSRRRAASADPGSRKRFARNMRGTPLVQPEADLGSLHHLVSAERLAVHLRARRRVGRSILHDVPAAGLSAATACWAAITAIPAVAGGRNRRR